MAWWFQRSRAADGASGAGVAQWIATRLISEVVQLVVGGGEGGVALAAAVPAAAHGDRPLIVRVVGEPERWALVLPAGGGARVNGLSVGAGIQMLRDRDAVFEEEAVAFFSGERIAEVEAFGGANGECGRCGIAFRKSEEVVRCPGCGTTYHQNEERRCWVYLRNPVCTFCERPATLDGKFLWTPPDGM